MDFIEGLPILEGEYKILVIVDRLTKYGHFMGVREIDSTKQIVEVFCNCFYKLHGFPKVIVSDRDAKFKGKFWREFCKQIGTSLNMNSAYHPQTYCQIEIVSKCYPPLASLGVSLDGRGSSRGDSELEPRHCASKDTLSGLDLAHVCKCV